MRVLGPNGTVVDVRESVATALVGDGSRGYKFATEPETKKVTPKPRRPRKKVTDPKS